MADDTARAALYIGLAILVAFIGTVVVFFMSTIFYYFKSLIYRRPIRIDLAFPRLPIDIVYVSEPVHIRSIIVSTACARLHAIPTKNMPRWVQLCYGAYHDPTRDCWFLPFEEEGEESRYSNRLNILKDTLESGHTREDVLKVSITSRSLAHCDKDPSPCE
jgi:hypothetical protein